MAAVHIIISGKVQGVFFRKSAKETADRTGVSGKVRNRDNGDVEIWASGTEQQLEKFMQWCRKGPSGARVDDVQIQELHDEFRGFVIVRG